MFIIARCDVQVFMVVYDRHYSVIFIQNVQIYGCAPFLLCIYHYKNLSNAIANACSPEKEKGKA